MRAMVSQFAGLAAVAFYVSAGGVSAAPQRPLDHENFWVNGIAAMRGVTIGPIESRRHPGSGYGTKASEKALDEVVSLGGTWVSLTPFGRVWDLTPTGVSLTFEMPFEENRAAVKRMVAQAHERGLRVFLIPHLWVETGGWRALIDPKSDRGWAQWQASYRQFLLTWAEVARETQVDMLSVGVELRSWVTSQRAGAFIDIIHDVRSIYPGLLTYSSNWDDSADTLIWDELDLVGINAFYPLAERPGSTFETQLAAGQEIARKVEKLSTHFARPVVLTEIGYTTRKDPALKPWEWPDGMSNVVVDERAQATSYAALIAPFLDARFCAGFFIWRLYADPNDLSQEAEWGFSPRGKIAELIVRDAFAAHWAADGPLLPGERPIAFRARWPGLFGRPWGP